MKTTIHTSTSPHAWRAFAWFLIVATAEATAQEAAATRPVDSKPASAPTSRPALDLAAQSSNLRDARAAMGKWIETQQIISRERKDWQQSKEILAGRVDVVKQEASALEEKIRTAESAAADAAKKKGELLAENDKLKEQAAALATAVTGMEADVKKVLKRVPEFIAVRLKPLASRIPEDPATTKVSVAERFQNVLGILNDLNKANNELTVNFEVRNLADGKPSEVRVLYVGLGQAYYLSARGESGTGRPGPDGWVWEPNPAIAADVLKTLEIIQGKHKPAFVPLPVKFQ